MVLEDFTSWEQPYCLLIIDESASLDQDAIKNKSKY